LSVSLILPLSVVWIELAIWNFTSSLWALMLFGANIVAVLVITTIFFWLYWFVPHKLKSQAKAFKRLVIVLFLVVFVIVPLAFSFNSIKLNNKISDQTKIYLENIIWEDSVFCTVSEVNVIKNTKDGIYLSAILKIPEWYNVDNIYNAIWQTLDEEFDKKAILDLEIIRITTIKSNV
jgi:uncharacterized membrane protein